MKAARVLLVASLALLGGILIAQDTKPAGRYVATVSAADSAGRKMLLVLGGEHTASLHTDYKNGKPSVVETGTWKSVDDKIVITLSLARHGEHVTRKPSTLAFTSSGDTLTGVDLDPARWGSAGLVFTRDTAGGLIGGSWHLTRVVHGHSEPIVPRDPSHYTLHFGEDGMVALLADCNRGRGKYTADPPRLGFGPIATTRMMCPPGSLDTIFLRDLDTVASFDIDDGELHLTLKDGAGSMSYERVP